MTIRRIAAVAAALALTAATAACQAPVQPAASASAAGSPATSATPAATWPRTVALDERTVTIPAAPKRIVALSPDVADVVMALTGSERLTAVPELTKRAEHSVNATTAAQVPNFLGTDAGKDPEKLIALNPDLIMLTTRHEAESDALKQLKNAGVPVLAVTNDWDTPERWAANVKAIAQALGEEAKGDKLVTDYQARWAKAAESAAKHTNKPTIAMIRILGPNTWLNGPGTIGHTVLGAAGGASASDKLGLKAGAKLDVEQLVKVDPDWIVVVDSSGKGTEQYKSILTNPALASVKAIGANHVVVVTSADLSSGTGGIGAFEKLTAALDKA